MRSLFSKITVISIAVVAALVLASVALTWLLSDQIARTESQRATLERLERIDQLAILVKDIQVDVIQVQQWLTDISATRGLDGLADGTQKAAESAAGFEQKSRRAAELATALGATGISASIEATRRAFPDYYAVGRRMADAYVKDGPAGGNPMMAAFDAAAERAYQSLQTLIDATYDLEIATTKDLHDSIATLAGASSGLRSAAVAGAVLIALGVALFCLYLYRAVSAPLHGIAHAIGALSAGGTTVAVPAVDRADEIGEIAKAVEGFGLSLAERAAQAEADARLAAEEKARAEAQAAEAAEASEDTEAE